ncbi:MAG: anhydro-N-acetylmuramic acid kinase [Actinomycetota bacterium]|nr:anhydro-N-acetylmuramic acid kinase [Actinomycetota bacterium]
MLEEAVGIACRRRLTAKTVTDALHRYGVEEVVTSGGGTRIPILMRTLRSNAPTERPRMIEDWGILSEITEA